MTLAAFSVAGLSAAQSDHQKATDENTRGTAKTVTVIRCHQWRSEGLQATHTPQCCSLACPPCLSRLFWVARVAEEFRHLPGLVNITRESRNPSQASNSRFQKQRSH